MNPPFYGVKTVKSIPLDEIFRLIDTHALFVGRWQFKRTKGTEEAYQKIIKEKVWPKFEELKKSVKDDGIFEPKVSYGYFKRSQILNLELRTSNSEPVPLQLVTIGSRVAEKCAELFKAGKYTDYLYLHGLAVEVTEALAEYSHRNILRELNIPFDAERPLPAMARISPGYHVWPSLADQKEMVRLLNAGEIGVELSETLQMVPEYSTSAMIVL
ncbi:MAG: hypothetical protein COV46_07040 [Deltaproteobacteria bacterium CG11_big_fil_rev_8_21_14_0_20_49_13]|nr:MAG: hypothetical protein COV46_07040 [Deltaproteobacteria bacterium CG11_big_fil_rev_8_21_14_0_20_49_13]